MISRKHQRCLLIRRPQANKRVTVAVCAGLIYATLPIVTIATATITMAPFSQAFAQATSAEDEELFLAVENNDLKAVRTAIESGASLDARDFNGMQPVDLAIDRGFFDIAHFLISQRNGTATTQQPVAQDTQNEPQITTPETALPPSEPAAVLPSQQPEAAASQEFDAIPPQEPDATMVQEPQTTSPLEPEVTADQEPTQEPDLAAQAPAQEQEPKPDLENAQTQTFNEVKKRDTQKTSAAKKFFSTFLDFFKPPNTTGIMRKEQQQEQPQADALTANELNARLQELEAELGPALQVVNPSLKPSVAETEQPASTVGQPGTADGVDPFGDFTSTDTATSEPAAAPTIKAPASDSGPPFGGGVDPDILAFLDGTYKAPDGAPTSSADTAAPAADPFAMDAPQDVAVLETKSPPSREAAPAADPFAEPAPAAADPFAEPAPAAADPFTEPTTPDNTDKTDVMAGLLETPDGANKPSGWDVKAVEGATIPDEVQVLSAIEPTGTLLEGVELALGADTVVGQQIDETRLTLMKEDTIHKPCLVKGGPDTMFCVDKVSWPFELEEDFLVDTIMYQGTSTVSRYDAGRATNFHALFKSVSFARVVDYYIKRYGQPSDVVQRAVAPLAKPRMDNPTYIWRSREAGTDTTTTLEIRKYDDEGESFPDTRRGLIKLYRSHAGSIFPQLSQLELMVLKANGSVDTFTAPTPEAVW